MTQTRPPRRLLSAFLIAPLASVPALALTMALVLTVQDPGRVLGFIAGAYHIAPFLAIFGLPIAYLVALLVGVPCYGLLAQHGRLTFGPIVAVTGALGGVGSAVGFEVFFSNGLSWLGLCIGIPAGVAVGATFWAIGIRQPSGARVA